MCRSRFGPFAQKAVAIFVSAFFALETDRKNVHLPPINEVALSEMLRDTYSVSASTDFLS
jgi:hypothetical protein